MSMDDGGKLLQAGVRAERGAGLMSLPPPRFAESMESLISRRRAAQTVEIRGCKSQGLGIRIVGGRNMTLADGRLSDFGIFVKEVIPDGLADKDGNHAATKH